MNTITEIAHAPAASAQSRRFLRDCRTCTSAESDPRGRATPIDGTRPLMQQPKPLHSKTAEIRPPAPAPGSLTVVARPVRQIARNTRGRTF
jgi:hypothetical protein